MKEIHFLSGYPTEEWVAVGHIKKHKLPCPLGGVDQYLPEQYEILEGECKGSQVSPDAPFIEVRERNQKKSP